MNEQLKNMLLSLEIDAQVVDKIENSNIFNDYITKNDFESQILQRTSQFAYDTQISMKLSQANARNLTACKSLIDIEKLSFDGQNVSGLDEQIQKIVTENPFLFEEFSYSPSSGISKQNTDNMSDLDYFNLQKMKNNGGF